jgi:hypothetical protein
MENLTEAITSELERLQLHASQRPAGFLVAYRGIEGLVILSGDGRSQVYNGYRLLGILTQQTRQTIDLTPSSDDYIYKVIASAEVEIEP